MPASIEIKAKVEDLSTVRVRAESLSDGPTEVLDQEDTSFATTLGRLKLRVFGDSRGN